MTSGQVSQLLAEILAAEDEADIVDLLTRNLEMIAEMSPRERERANERIADAIREHRQRNEPF